MPMPRLRCRRGYWPGRLWPTWPTGPTATALLTALSPTGAGLGPAMLSHPEPWLLDEARWDAPLIEFSSVKY